jgi:hypothetical protein
MGNQQIEEDFCAWRRLCTGLIEDCSIVRLRPLRFHCAAVKVACASLVLGVLQSVNPKYSADSRTVLKIGLRVPRHPSPISGDRR